MNQRILLEVQGKNRLYQLFDDSFNIHAISCTPEYGQKKEGKLENAKKSKTKANSTQCSQAVSHPSTN